MHRIDGPAAAPGGRFTDGDPAVGTPATVVTDDWLNAVQDELANVIESTGAALSKPSNDQLLTAIRALVTTALPAGAVMPFAMAAAPAGWLVCDGSTVSAAAYPALAAALGATYGAAPAGQVRLPDLRGEFVRGVDAGRGIDAGRVFGSAQGDSLKAHTHTLPSDSLDNTGDGYVADSVGGGAARTAITGSTGEAETRPRNVAMLYCVKT